MIDEKWKTVGLPVVKINNKLTVVLPNGQPKTVSSADSNYQSVLDAITNKEWHLIPDLMDPKTAIFEFSDGNFEVKDGVVHINNKPVPDKLSKKIIEFVNEKLPYEPLLNFWVKLQKNPSHRAVNSLYDFLLAHNYPITPEGNFIAYRGVKADWTDQHTGTMDNSVGTVVSMPRNEVDENPDHTCSTGLHIGNWEHANGSYGLAQGGHTVMVEVSPENVVSIPSAYENAKMRVCEFKVLQEVEGKITGNLYNPNFVSHDEEEDDSDEECYYEHKINYDSDCEEEDCCHNIGCEDCWEGCAEK